MIGAISSLLSSVTGAASSMQLLQTTPAVASGSTAAPSFGDVLKQVSSDAIHTMAADERTAIAGIQGKATTQQVAEAVMSAERTLQTAIAIRDKAVSAYQQISQMTI